MLIGCDKENKEFILQKINSINVAQGTLYGAGREGIVRQNLVIKDNDAWQNLINQMNVNNNVSETFTETDINFAEYKIIAMFDEVKGCGGWSIDVIDITEYSDKIVVTGSNLKTGNASSVITQPFQVVKIPNSDKNVIFETFYKNIGEGSV
jgi:hypothetical protein